MYPLLRSHILNSESWDSSDIPECIARRSKLLWRIKYAEKITFIDSKFKAF